MSHLQLPINGLTHHDVKERREEFVDSALGQTVMLVAMPIAEDQRCVAAYVDGLRIGNVKGDHVLAAQRALLASPVGVIMGRFVGVKNDGFCLLADFGAVPMVGAEDVERMLPLGLGSWTCSVPTMCVPPLMQQAGVMLKLLWASVEADAVEGAAALSERLFGLMRYDLSQEMRRERGLLVQRMLQSPDARMQAAAARLEEAITRMGGETQMTEVGRWLQEVVAQSAAADLLLAACPQTVTRQQVLQEAAALPCGLLHLWQTSGRDFASVLYGMRLSREDVLRVVSCLVWLERTAGEEGPRESAEVDAFVHRIVQETKHFYKHNRQQADAIRQIMIRVGRADADAELDDWIEGREQNTAISVAGDLIFNQETNIDKNYGPNIEHTGGTLSLPGNPS